MENKILDTTITDPVTDICAYGDKIIISAYDKSLRMYANQVLFKCIYLSSVVCKICSDGTNIICGSQNGTVYVFDGCLTLIESFVLFPDVSVMLCHANTILVGSWGKMLASVFRLVPDNLTEGNKPAASLGEVDSDDRLLDMGSEKFSCPENSRNSNCGVKTHAESSFAGLERQIRPKTPQLYMTEFIRVCKYSISAAASDNGKTAIAFENILKLYDSSFSEILSKTMPCNINTVVLTQQGVYMGLISGKIHFEHFTDSDESFIFNAHTETKNEEKTFHSVNQLCLNDFLYSAGSDGKIYKWNVASRRYITSVFSCGSNIKKFLIHANCLYVLPEDILDRSSLGRIVYAHLKE